MFKKLSEERNKEIIVIQLMVQKDITEQKIKVGKKLIDTSIHTGDEF